MTTKTKPKRRTKAEQRAETLEGILDAAEYLFSQRGLYGVTLKDVAGQAGVHTSLLHYYFDDKKAMFDAVFARRAHVTADLRSAALDRYAVPHRDYYEWCAPNAGGFVLDARDWKTQHILHLVKTVQYTKGATC